VKERSWSILASGLALGLLTCACDGGRDAACDQGTERVCLCADGAEGTQACLADGSGWEACACCTPACAGRSCGPDGCGGSCGECTAPATCTAEGACECAPDCAGRACGLDPVCGAPCGTCLAPDSCDALGQCGCDPACGARVCGPDPVCGQSCGGCDTAAGEWCDVDGACQTGPCQPDCGDRECGPDPVCGTLHCGACPDPNGCICLPTGMCDCCEPDCSATQCGPDPACGVPCGDCLGCDGQPDPGLCDQGQCAILCCPACAGKGCGPDGCGGSCGTCAGAAEVCLVETGQCAEDPAWPIEAGRGVGPVDVSLSLASFTTLDQVRAALWEDGSLVPDATYTMSFLGDRLWVAGIDVNGSKSFDGPDHVLSVIARPGLDAQTPQGLRVGSTQAEVRAGLGEPDHSEVLAASEGFEGGRVDEYFGLGLFVNYGPDDLARAITVTRVYSAPDGSFDPVAGTLTYGGTTIYLGNGLSTGDAQAVHRAAVGEPDWPSGFERVVETGGDPVSVQFYVDSYRIQGLEFIGVDTVAGVYERDRLVLVALYPFYYGQAADGLRIGSPKSALDAAYGAPTVVQDPAWTGVLYVYTAGTRELGALFTDDGQDADDTAVMLLLNYQSP